MLRNYWLLLVAALVIQFCPINAEEAENSEFPYLGEVFDLNDSYTVKVNMRAGDGLNYRILRVATEGDELTVVASRGDWLQVTLAEGSTLNAWVKTKFLKIEENKATVNADRVSLRADRSLNSEVLTSMKNGLKLSVIKVDGAWVKVSAPKGTTSWISAKYVRLKEKLIGSEDSVTKRTDEEEVVANATTKSDKAGTVSQKGKVTDKKGNKGNKGDSSKPVTVADKLKALSEKFEKQLKDKVEAETKKYESFSVFEGQYLVIGLVVNLTSNKNKKATHKLEYKKRTQYLLKTGLDDDSKRKLFDLSKYSGKMVGIDGNVKLLDDGQRLVTVKKITVLNSPK